MFTKELDLVSGSGIKRATVVENNSCSDAQGPDKIVPHHPSSLTREPSKHSTAQLILRLEK